MVTLRPYKDTDFEAYSETLLKTWPYDKIEDARESVAGAVKKLGGAKKEEIWVAEFEGEAAGFILLEFTRVWGSGENESFEKEAAGIDWFDVNPKFQRKGIGKELLRKAEERGREMGLGILFMHTATKNLPMINFASTSGFKFEKYLTEFWGKGTKDAFLLAKAL